MDTTDGLVHMNMMTKYSQDALVGDAILMSGILDFCVLVLEDDHLENLYGDKANSYVELAKKSFVEKWDKRGTWYEAVVLSANLINTLFSAG